LRILVTYGWCRTAYDVARSLSAAGHDVYSCASSRLAMTRYSRSVKGFDLVPDPFADPRVYTDAVGSVASKRRVELIVPVHEDALVLQKHADRLPRSVTVAAPPADKLETGLDKWKIVCVARNAGVETPHTFAPSSATEMDECLRRLPVPVVVKTRRGNSGKGVVISQSRAEAAVTFSSLVTRLSLPTDQLPLVQEFVDGTGFGSCFLAKQGRVLACFVERYLQCKQDGFGTSVMRIPMESAQAVEATKAMAQALDWTGVGHFDFIESGDGQRRVLIEMNPRFWGALQMAIANGYDFPRALVEMVTSGQPSPDSIRPVDDPVAGVWVVGQTAATLRGVALGRLRAPLYTHALLRSFRGRLSYDDWSRKDPAPFFAEAADYVKSFVRSGFSMNPATDGMLRA
jgi:predicted ATP-grasp superfamily ATP-dependent carboligase